MDKDQKKYILTRIENARNPNSYFNSKRKPKPMHVRRAMLAVARYERYLRQDAERHERRFLKVKNKAVQAAHFGTVPQALAALKALESFK